MPEGTKRSIVLLIDENVDADLASELRKRGIDAINVQEAQLRNLTDEALLQYAVSEKRAILTHNIRHFITLHNKTLKEGKNHNGIIVAKDFYIGNLLKKILSLADSQEDLTNRVIYL